MGRALKNTQTTVYYQYVVQLRGRPIGTIQRFNPSSDKALQRITQIMGAEGNDYVEILPGRTDTSLVIDRLETNSKCIAQILNDDENFMTIEDINEPLDIVEIMTPPGEGKKRVRHYFGCMVKNHNKTVNVENISITEQVTFWVTNVIGGVAG